MDITRQSKCSMCTVSRSGWKGRNLLKLASLARMGVVRWRMQSACEYYQSTEFQRWTTQCRQDLIKGADTEGQRSHALTQVHRLACRSGDKNPGLQMVSWVHSEAFYFQRGGNWETEKVDDLKIWGGETYRYRAHSGIQ